jgi:hypothetical protein
VARAVLATVEGAREAVETAEAETVAARVAAVKVTAGRVAVREVETVVMRVAVNHTKMECPQGWDPEHCQSLRGWEDGFGNTNFRRGVSP